jgi:hypothetical protein
MKRKNGRKGRRDSSITKNERKEKREKKGEKFWERKRLLDNNSGRMGERDRTIDDLRLIKEWKKERVCLTKTVMRERIKIDRKRQDFEI